MFSTGIFIHLIYKMMILDSSYTAKCFWGGLEHIDGIFLLYYNFWYMYFDFEPWLHIGSHLFWRVCRGFYFKELLTFHNLNGGEKVEKIESFFFFSRLGLLPMGENIVSLT